MAIAFFVDRLRSVYPLGDADMGIVFGFGSNIVSHRRLSEIVRQGEPSAGAGVLLDGLAGRCKLTKDGKRQIVSLICPGDVLGLEGVLKDVSDHCILALTDCQVAVVSHTRLRDIFENHPAVSLALWKLFVLDTSVYREWLVNIGSRSALARTAHLICELYFRFAQVGRVQGGSFSWPMSQSLVGEVLALTTVHVNRTLQKLRDLELIRLNDRTMEILDWQGLADVAQFDCSYLLTSSTAANERRLNEALRGDCADMQPPAARVVSQA